MGKNIEKQYLKLLKDILKNGVEKQDRTGTGTISVFGRQIRHDMSKGFPLLTTKKMYWKGIVTELLWFLRGDTNIKYLVDNDCHIWDGDAYKNYCKEFEKGNAPGKTALVQRVDGKSMTKKLSKEEFIAIIKTDDEFAERWGDLGPVYGKQWRRWPVYPNEYGEYESNPIDQIQNLIDELKTNPDSRRLMVSAWNPSDLHDMVLPPCHYGFQVYTRELTLKERLNLFDEFFDVTNDSENMNESEIHESLSESNIPTRAISLSWNQRSVDVFLGLPFNIASYALLLKMIADEVNMIPEELIGNLGDTHLYKNHIEQAKEQMTREPMNLPQVTVQDGILCSSVNDVRLENYESHPPIKAPLSN